MKFTKSQRIAAVLGAGAIAVAGSGVAFAVWTDVTNPAAVTGTVSSNGDTLTLTTSGSLPTTLGQSTDIHVYATNVTKAAQVLHTLTASLTAAGCTVGNNTKDFTIDSSNIAITSVDANTASVDQGYFTVTLNNLAGNQDACQGASMSFQVTGT